MVDVPSGAVVTNDFPQITHDLFFEWRDHHRPDAPDLWPADLREEMEAVMERVFTEVNNGVYRCGFAGSQEAYDEAYDRLWTAMDWLEERLADRRYLMGDTITEADVRLFTTLARFDAVYHGHFKCNRNKLTEMPALWGYARDLFQTPGFGETIDFDQIKQHYYVVQTDINPSRDRPAGARTRPAGGPRTAARHSGGSRSSPGEGAGQRALRKPRTRGVPDLLQRRWAANSERWARSRGERPTLKPAGQARRLFQQVQPWKNSSGGRCPRDTTSAPPGPQMPRWERRSRTCGRARHRSRSRWARRQVVR